MGIAKANTWLGAATGVQMVIVVKINNRTAAGVSLIALRFERGAVGPAYAVSFGTRALNPCQVNTINALGNHLLYSTLFYSAHMLSQNSFFTDAKQGELRLWELGTVGWRVMLRALACIN